VATATTVITLHGISASDLNSTVIATIKNILSNLLSVPASKITIYFNTRREVSTTITIAVATTNVALSTLQNLLDNVVTGMSFPSQLSTAFPSVTSVTAGSSGNTSGSSSGLSSRAILGIILGVIIGTGVLLMVILALTKSAGGPGVSSRNMSYENPTYDKSGHGMIELGQTGDSANI